MKQMQTRWMAGLLLMLMVAPIWAQPVQADTETTTETAEATDAEKNRDQQIREMIDQETNLAALVQLAEAARGNGDYGVMEMAATRLLNLRPEIGEFQLLLARAFALQEKKAPAYNLLVRMDQQGLSYPIQDLEDLSALKGDEVYDYLVERFQLNGEPVGRAQLVNEIPRTDLLVDGIAWDPKREQYLLGSVTQGSILLMDNEGKLSPFITADEKNGLLGVFDLAVDAERRVLWVTSNAVAHFERVRFQDAGRSGLWKFDLDSGDLLDRFDLPPGSGATLNTITLGPDGSAYVADSRQPAVYKVAAEDNKLLRLFRAPGFASLRGLALDPSGRHLYFSDYQQGLYAVDLKEQKTVELQEPDNANVGGVDAMVWHDGALVLVQNGTSPVRLVRAELEDNGVTISQFQLLVSGLPDLDSPANGVAIGKELHLVSLSHWNDYDAQSGKPREDAELSRPKIMAVDMTETNKRREEMFDPNSRRE